MSYNRSKLSFIFLLISFLISQTYSAELSLAKKSAASSNSRINVIALIGIIIVVAIVVAGLLWFFHSKPDVKKLEAELTELKEKASQLKIELEAYFDIDKLGQIIQKTFASVKNLTTPESAQLVKHIQQANKLFTSESRDKAAEFIVLMTYIETKNKQLEVEEKTKSPAELIQYITQLLTEFKNKSTSGVKKLNSQIKNIKNSAAKLNEPEKTICTDICFIFSDMTTKISAVSTFLNQKLQVYKLTKKINEITTNVK